jgi:uncharacterized protein (DUF488 family)
VVATLYTLGHSTRTLDELLTLLDDAGVRMLADIRRFPASRRHPQHNRGALAAELATRGIGYRWLGESLGGRRKATLPVEKSPNRAWQVEAFRNYADAMTSPEFLAGVEELEALGRAASAAYMCAEKPWWKCHRRILSDLLVARGWEVVHLIDPGKREVHELSAWARVREGMVSYPSLC